MKRFLFLDFDGVINTPRYRQLLAAHRMPVKDQYGPFFDPMAVENLTKIISATGADIIVTSTWKFKGLAAMQALWSKRSMPGLVIDITPSIMAGFLYNRGMEINKWIAENVTGHPTDYRYAIIDDGQDFLPEQAPHLITTDPTTGLSEYDAEKAIQLL